MTSSGFMTYAMLVIFIQNAVISGAAGLNQAYSSAFKPKTIPVTGLLVSLFTILCSLPMYPLNRFYGAETSYMPVHAAILTVFIILWYLIIAKIISKIPPLDDNIGNLIAPAALNGAVVGIPLLLNYNQKGSEISELFGAGLGAGVGFILAAFLIAAGLRFSDKAGVPKAFGGAPLMLIYIGILSMAFSVFDGGSITYIRF